LAEIATVRLDEGEWREFNGFEPPFTVQQPYRVPSQTAVPTYTGILYVVMQTTV